MNQDYQSIKARKATHKALKIHCATNNVNMIDFVDQAILNEIEKFRWVKSKSKKK